MILAGHDFAKVLERLFKNLARQSPLYSFINDDERLPEPVAIPMVVGMGIPIDPNNDTSTSGSNSRGITIDFSPRYSYSPCYATNCSSWYHNPSDEGSDEKRWRKYWAEFLVNKKTPYTKLQHGRSGRVTSGCRKFPCLSVSQKVALSPAQHAHRRFVTRMMKPVRPLV
jgi:hypothetical protein